METFYPSCNFARIAPQAAKKLRLAMKEQMATAGCCLRDRRVLGANDVGIYMCQACREHIQGGATQSLWSWLVDKPNWEYPSYKGLSVIIQDCWRDQDHPEVHAAVRELLERMGVAWSEPKDARARSTFCGTLHVEPRTPKQRQLMATHPNPNVRDMPHEIQAELMAERVAELAHSTTPRKPPLILTYCNACTQGIQLGGGQVVHLGELVMGAFDPVPLAGAMPAACA